MASFAAAFYTFSPLRDSLSTLPSSTRLIVGGVCSRVPGTPAVRVPLPGPRRMHDLVRPRRTSGLAG